MIRREPPGLAGMYGRAAVLAGRAEAERTRARTQAQMVMHRYDRDQQVQLAMLRMRNDNEMIRFREDMDLLTRKRAQAFTLEQIETRARMDSAREERDRQQNLDELKQGLKAINEYPYMTDEEKTEAAYKFRMRKQYDYTVPTEREPTGITEPGLARGVKFLSQYGERFPYGEEAPWYKPFAPEPTEEETLMKEYYERLVREGLGAEVSPIAGMERGYQVPAKVSPGMYQMNQIIERGGRKYRVVGFDDDGMPLVELL